MPELVRDMEVLRDPASADQLFLVNCAQQSATGRGALTTATLRQTMAIGVSCVVCMYGYLCIVFVLVHHTAGRLATMSAQPKTLYTGNSIVTLGCEVYQPRRERRPRNQTVGRLNRRLCTQTVA